MLKSVWLSLLLTALGVAFQTPISILLGVWALRLRARWSVGPDGLRAEHEATNLSGEPAPTPQPPLHRS